MSRLALLSLFVIAVGCSQARTGVPAADSAPVATAAECAAPAELDSTAMMRDVFRLADDSMRGRLIGSPGALKARDYLAARFDAIGLESPAGGRLQQIVVNSPRLPGVTAAWNVLGIVRGTAQPERWILVTAHYDHVGIGRPVDGDSIYNGADDNASGAAALAVMAQQIQRQPLRHSVLFAAVDGEERGMPGSRGLVNALPMPIGDVALNVNLDMISRNTSNELYVAGPGRYPALTAPVEAAVRCAPVKLRIGHDTPAAGPGEDWTSQSDHAAFHAKGIPFLYFGVEDHPDYHRPGDHADRVMPEFYVGAVRTVLDVMRRVDGQ